MSEQVKKLKEMGFKPVDEQSPDSKPYPVKWLLKDEVEREMKKLLQSRPVVDEEYANLCRERYEKWIGGKLTKQVSNYCGTCLFWENEVLMFGFCLHDLSGKAETSRHDYCENYKPCIPVTKEEIVKISKALFHESVYPLEPGESSTVKMAEKLEEILKELGVEVGE